MMYSVNNGIVDSISRCITAKDGYILTFTGKKCSDSTLIAQLTACDGSAISVVSFPATPIMKVEPKSVMVGCEFASAIKALSQAGNTITFDLQETFMNVSCGNASIRIDYRDTVTMYEMQSPKSVEHATFSIETKEWKRAFSQGGFICCNYDESAGRALFNYAYLMPTITGDAVGVRILSCNGYYASSSSALVKEKDQKFLDMAKSSMSVCIPPRTIKAINSVLKSESITVYCFQNQLLIRDGNDMFNIVLGTHQMVPDLLALVDDVSYTYKFVVDSSHLKVALDVMSVKSKDLNTDIMTLSTSEKGLCASSKDVGSTAVIKTSESEGNISLCLCIKQVKDILNSGCTEENTVTIFGKDSASPIHIVSGNCIAFTAPCATDTE